MSFIIDHLWEDCKCFINICYFLIFPMFFGYHFGPGWSNVKVISFGVRRSSLIIVLSHLNTSWRTWLIRNHYDIFCAASPCYVQILECLLWSMNLLALVDTFFCNNPICTTKFKIDWVYRLAEKKSLKARKRTLKQNSGA